MQLRTRIEKLEKYRMLSSMDFSELTDDELQAIIGDDYKRFSKLTDQELEEIIRNEHQKPIR